MLHPNQRPSAAMCSATAQRHEPAHSVVEAKPDGLISDVTDSLRLAAQSVDGAITRLELRADRLFGAGPSDPRDCVSQGIPEVQSEARVLMSASTALHESIRRLHAVVDRFSDL